jgi:hypothetical protein
LITSGDEDPNKEPENNKEGKYEPTDLIYVYKKKSSQQISYSIPVRYEP